MSSERRAGSAAGLNRPKSLLSKPGLQVFLVFTLGLCSLVVLYFEARISQLTDDQELADSTHASIRRRMPRAGLPFAQHSVSVDTGKAAVLNRVACSRGVTAGEISRYCCSGSFVCDAGERSIACDRVNDSYCDCADGSDELGTPACAAQHARFACRNGRTISTAFVDDGVCDCCDGADEPPTRKCPSACPS